LVKTARLYYEQSLTQAVRRTASAFSPEGAAKLKAIRAALEGRLVNVLVTDHLTAERLLGQVRE
jgi:DNA-binding transcriptional regulator LsrR (DeoR family)